MSEFDNWKEEQERIHNDYDAENAWYAGQQSQQAKIDQLNEKNSEEKRILHNVIEMNQAKIGELQARADEALRFYNEAKSPHNIGMIQMAIYLKGNKDEN